MSLKGQLYQLLTYEEKHFALKNYFENGLAIRDVATVVGVGESTVREWLKTINCDFKNIELLKPKQRPVHKHNLITELPDWVKTEILDQIKQHSGMGALKLKQYFYRHHQQIVPEKKIYFFLKEKGIIAGRNVKKEPKQEHNRRFEYPAPMIAVQVDPLTLKLSGGIQIYMVTFLDDYSRYILLSQFIVSKEMDEIIRLLRETIRAYGLMERIITDKGSEFVSWQSFTRFEQLLCDLDIELIASGPETPQNQGKIEKWHQTFRKECEKECGGFDSRSQAQFELNNFVSYYNYERPHQALGGLVPADRFYGVAEDLENELASYKTGQRPKECIYFCCNINGKRLVVSGPRNGELTVHQNGKKED